MSITKFGEFTRDLRLGCEQNLKEMAENLEVTSAFLSAVENGKKNVPKDWFKKITNIYHLAKEKQDELSEAISDAKTKVVINLTKSKQTDRDLALVFARSFEELTDDEKKKMMGILTKKKRKKKNA